MKNTFHVIIKEEVIHEVPATASIYSLLNDIEPSITVQYYSLPPNNKGLLMGKWREFGNKLVYVTYLGKACFSHS